MQVRGPILPLLEVTFQTSQGILGLVGPAATGGVVVTLLIGGLRAGTVDMRRLLILAAVLAAVATIGVAWSPTIGVLLVFMGLQGVGAGLFRAFDRPILGHMYAESRGRVFSYYTAIWAIGAATAPVLTNFVVRYGSWRSVYILLVAPLILCAGGLYRLSDPPRTETEQSLTWSEMGALVRRPSVVATVVLVILSGGLEGTIFTWFPYFARTHVSPALANTLLTYFFLAYIPGRILAGTVLQHVDNLRFVLILSLLSLPSLYFTVVDTANLALGIAASGMFISGLFPALLAYGVAQAPEYSGPLNSVATSASFGGVTLFPMMIGVLAGQFGISGAMKLTLLLTGSLCIGTFVVIIRFR